MKRILVSLLCFITISGVCSKSAQAMQYKVHDIGIMFNIINFTDINSNGQIVGYRSVPDFNIHFHATVWSNYAVGNEVQDLGTIGGTISIAYGTNNKGQVVGFTDINGGTSSAFIWDPNATGNKMTTLDGMGNNSSASAINNIGQVVGIVNYIYYNHSDGFFWDSNETSNKVNIINTPGNCGNNPTSINDNSQVVGNYYLTSDFDSDCHAFFLDTKVTGNNGAIDLGTLGGRCSSASAINNNGQIVGYSDITYGITDIYKSHAVLWYQNKVKDLGTLGGNVSRATDINNLGQIVGTSYCDNNSNMSHAFLWQNDIMTDLGTLGGKHSEATAINDKGWIVGMATDENEYGHAVVWEPVPEPSAILTLISGVSALTGLALRRKK